MLFRIIKHDHEINNSYMLSVDLKEKTKNAHLELEKIVVQQLRLIRSETDYAQFLKGFYTYFSQVEAEIAPYITPKLLPDYDDRRNSGYLKTDIEELGGDVSDVKTTEMPKISNALQALGALYVMEGSIMGGRIIVQMLEKSGIRNGISFFSGYGADTGEKWGAFIEVLNSQTNDKALQDQAIEAANQTFLLFANVFQK
ncbi:biliverdin-producing heme oxygenase [Pedobacter sp. PWIIR3]